MNDVPIPTFLSIDEDQCMLHGLTYEQYLLHRYATIWFNGERHPGCIAADTERGYIDVWVRPTFGGLVHRLWGEVRIEVRNA